VADSASTADVGFADCFQSSTPYSVAKGYPNVEGASGNTVGVIPYVWVKTCANTSDTDYASWQRLTNITGFQVKFLYANGYASTNFLTGNNSDTAYLFALGRDTDSGTRLDALAESGVGQYTSIQQFLPVVDGTAGVGGTIDASTTGTQVGSTLTATISPGAGGSNSGGSLALSMATPGWDANTGGYGIAYLGVADADTLLSPGTGPSGYVPGAYLTFNGVGCSLTSINNGTYQFWAYEHYLLRPSGDSPALTTDQATVSSALQTDLVGTDAAVAGYKSSQVTATKTVEGGVITPPIQ
jgi:hypothetical protein